MDALQAVGMPDRLTDNVDRSRQLYRGRKGVIHGLPCAELGKQKLHVVSQMHTSIITLLELAFLSTIFRVP